MADLKQLIPLRVYPENTVGLRKWVIVLAVAILAVIVGFSVFKALTPRQSMHTSDKSNVSVAPLETTPPILEKLPTDYQDTEKIKPYLPQTTTTTIPPEVESAIRALQEEGNALRAQLLQLKAQPISPPMDSHTEQAMSSSLFFHEVPPNDEKAFLSSLPTQASSKAESTQSLTEISTSSKPFSWSNKTTEEEIYNPHTLQKPVSPYEIQAGTIIPATLITALNTSLPGEAVAQVREDIYDTVTGHYLLVPKGTKLLGEYDSKIAYGQERVLIAFNRLIRPDGSSIILANSSSMDAGGESGMAANVNNHWSKILGAAVISTLLSVGAGVAADHMAPRDIYHNSAPQNAALGGAEAISAVGANLTNRAIAVQPTLTLPSGYQFDVIVTKDVILEPFSN